MSTETEQKKVKPLKKKKKNLNPVCLLEKRGGQSNTLLLYPLHNSIQEPEIEEFVKRASLSSPIRIEICKFQSSNNTTNTNDTNNDMDMLRKDQVNNHTSNYNSYAYCTFLNYMDAWLTKKHLAFKRLHNRQVNITFINIPRSDLEGLTNIIEFQTNYPPITRKDEIINFLNSYNNTVNDDEINLKLISNPQLIKKAPGHGGIKGKWFLTYNTPSIATKALEFYSGKYYWDNENNLERFVIMNYQNHRSKTPLDRKACFYGITDRVRLRNLNRNITDNDDVLLFLQSNGYDVNKDVKDVHIIHQLKHVVRYNQGSKKRKKKNRKIIMKLGYAIVTLASYKLAEKAYTNLNDKYLNDSCKIATAFDSPHMADPLKKRLRDNTNTVHLNNLPWNVSIEQVSKWLASAGKRYVKNFKGKVGKEEVKEEKNVSELSSDNPYIGKDDGGSGGEYDTTPVRVNIKCRDGYSTGRGHAAFITNEQANIVVDLLNGCELGGRKIALNWAVPIKEKKYLDKRNNKLAMEAERNKNKVKNGKKGNKKNEWNWKENGNDKRSVNKNVYGPVDVNEANEGKDIGDDDNKRGKKRKQIFDNPSSKRVKLESPEKVVDNDEVDLDSFLNYSE